MWRKKKLISLVLALVLCLSTTGCGLIGGLIGGKTDELSDEEVINTFMEAFKQGDYEGIKPYISEDNPLHEFFGCMDESVGGEMASVYKAVYDRMKDKITWTAKAVEGKEAWGTVEVTLSIPNYYDSICAAMVEALEDQVKNGGTAFHDMPTWIAAGAQGEEEIVEETYELHVGNRDGNNVMDTNTNRQFFLLLCGGLRYFLNATITTCTFPDEGGTWDILSQGDEIVAMINTETVPMGDEFTQEDLEAIVQNYEDSMSGMDGIIASAVIENGDIVASIGVDMANASTYALSNMGLISDRITAGSNGWLSLDSTISGFTRDGATCVTESFKNQE